MHKILLIDRCKRRQQLIGIYRIGQGGTGQPLQASGGDDAIDAWVAGCCPRYSTCIADAAGRMRVHSCHV
jgi:hypothetical protein